MAGAGLGRGSPARHPDPDPGLPRRRHHLRPACSRPGGGVPRQARGVGRRPAAEPARGPPRLPAREPRGHGARVPDEPARAGLRPLRRRAVLLPRLRRAPVRRLPRAARPRPRSRRHERRAAPARGSLRRDARADPVRAGRRALHGALGPRHLLPRLEAPAPERAPRGRAGRRGAARGPLAGDGLVDALRGLRLRSRPGPRRCRSLLHRRAGAARRRRRRRGQRCEAGPRRLPGDGRGARGERRSGRVPDLAGRV